MTAEESDALEAFERLGLTSYESKVFIALQRLGSGTARDVADVADVPRSQVYSVADSLEDRGLVEVQQSNPIQYRPVSVDEAREILRDRFETEQERAFEYVESVREEPDAERQEDIWTVRGRDRIDDRTLDVIEGAEEWLVFACRVPDLVTDEIDRTLRERADAGIDVTVVSSNDAISERFANDDRIRVTGLPPHYESDHSSGRVIYADYDTVLLSVYTGDEETAFWSAESNFASVLIQLILTSIDLEPRTRRS